MFSNCRPRQVLKYAGTMAACSMGSGFATGQEIMQFFTVHGLNSLWSVLIMMIIAIPLSLSVALAAEQNCANTCYHPYLFFTGRRLGTLFQWFGCILVVLVFIVVVSGAGATINTCFGIPYWLGCIFIILLALATFMAGMRRLVDILGCIGPVAVCLLITIALLALAQFSENLSLVPAVLTQGNFITASQQWWLGGLLYTSGNFFFPILFMTQLVQNAHRPREAVLGATIGTVAFALGLGAINIGMLTVLGDLVGISVPTVTMASIVSPVLGSIYSLLLICLVYGSASSILFIGVTQIAPILGGRQKLTALLICALSLTSGLIPFDKLVNVVYSYMGYICFIMLIGVLIQLPKLIKDA